MMLSKHVRSALAFVLLVLLIACPALAQTDPHEGRGSFLIQQIPLGIWYGVGMSSFLTNDKGQPRHIVTL
jgi:hypothetical protein